MKRLERRLAGLGVVLLLAGWQLTARSHGAMRDIVLADACRTPLRELLPTRGGWRGSAVVFHGLSANGRLMQTLGQWLAAAGLRVYLVDSPGHGDSTEPFSFARAEWCAGAVLDSLARAGSIVPDQTVLVGHSMGGAIAIRLTDRFRAVATIAVSPAPMIPPAGVPASLVLFTPPRKMAANLLLFVGGFEPSASRESAAALVKAAEGKQTRPEDSPKRRAARLVEIPFATHTSLLFDHRVARLSADWAGAAVGSTQAANQAPPGAPLAGGLLGLAGLMLVFPAFASGVASAFRVQAREATWTPPSTGAVFALWALTALAAVLILKYWLPLRPLRIFTGDYLASFLFLMGMALLAWLRWGRKTAVRFEWRAVAMACTLGVATILAFGVWLNWQLDQAWMNAARWLRFLPLVLACLPYSLAEEIVLGPPERFAAATSPRWRARRYMLFLALRLILFLALAFAVAVLGSKQILILLLAVYLAAFSLAQQAGSAAVRGRTGALAAAAMFGAILAAWFIAAVFPLT